MPRIPLAAVAPLLLLPAPLAGQTLASADRGRPATARSTLSFAARPEVCGERRPRHHVP